MVVLDVFGVKEKRPILLKLEKFEDSIRVVVVDEVGDRKDCGDLLLFKSDGTVYFARSVNPSFGFKLDGNGEIMVSR